MLDQRLPLAAYLAAGPLVDADHPTVVTLAAELRTPGLDDVAFAAAAFDWVRDEVAHSLDAQDPRVTLRASDVLRERVGLCYAKSVLLAAVLRRGGVPAGLCYQRLADGTGGHALHGLVAVHLDGAWHRQDPRGNKPGVDARFSLRSEHLACAVAPRAGECDYADLLVEPPSAVVAALSAADDIRTCRLPADIA